MNVSNDTNRLSTLTTAHSQHNVYGDLFALYSPSMKLHSKGPLTEQEKKDIVFAKYSDSDLKDTGTTAGWLFKTLLDIETAAFGDLTMYFNEYGIIPNKMDYPKFELLLHCFKKYMDCIIDTNRSERIPYHVFLMFEGGLDIFLGCIAGIVNSHELTPQQMKKIYKDAEFFFKDTVNKLKDLGPEVNKSYAQELEKFQEEYTNYLEALHNRGVMLDPQAKLTDWVGTKILMDTFPPTSARPTNVQPQQLFRNHAKPSTTSRQSSVPIKPRPQQATHAKPMPKQTQQATSAKPIPQRVRAKPMPQLPQRPISTAAQVIQQQGSLSQSSTPKPPPVSANLIATHPQQYNKRALQMTQPAVPNKRQNIGQMLTPASAYPLLPSVPSMNSEQTMSPRNSQLSDDTEESENPIKPRIVTSNEEPEDPTQIDNALISPFSSPDDNFKNACIETAKRLQTFFDGGDPSFRKAFAQLFLKFQGYLNFETEKADAFTSFFNHIKKQIIEEHRLTQENQKKLEQALFSCFKYPSESAENDATIAARQDALRNQQVLPEETLTTIADAVLQYKINEFCWKSKSLSYGDHEQIPCFILSRKKRGDEYSLLPLRAEFQEQFVRWIKPDMEASSFKKIVETNRNIGKRKFRFEPGNVNEIQTVTKAYFKRLLDCSLEIMGKNEELKRDLVTPLQYPSYHHFEYKSESKSYDSKFYFIMLWSNLSDTKSS